MFFKIDGINQNSENRRIARPAPLAVNVAQTSAEIMQQSLKSEGHWQRSKLSGARKSSVLVSRMELSTVFFSLPDVFPACIRERLHID